MDIGAILIGLAILVLAVPYVAGPFRDQKKRKNKRGKVAEKKTGSEDLKQQEEIALKKLRDLDFDYQTGKVSEEDYHPLRNQLVADAAQLIEAVKQEEARLEEQLHARWQAKAQKEKCPACGGVLTPEDRFCPTCGQPVITNCQNCGKTIRPGDLFCPACGSPVQKPSRVVAVNQG